MRRVTIIASLCLSLAGPVRAQVLPLHADRHTLQGGNDRTVDLSAAKWKGPVLDDPRFQHLSRDAAAAESAFSSSSSITISTTVIIIALLVIILLLVA